MAEKRKAMRILSVGSNRVLTQTRNIVLAHAGYAIRPVYSLAATIATLEKQTFDLIVIGHSLGLVQQAELIRRVRTISKAPVLVVAHSLQEDVGADAYVEGIEGPEKLLAVVSTLLARSTADSNE